MSHSGLYDTIAQTGRLRDSPVVKLEGVHCRTPTGEVLFRDLGFEVHEGQNLLCVPCCVRVARDCILTHCRQQYYGPLWEWQVVLAARYQWRMAHFGWLRRPPGSHRPWWALLRAAASVHDAGGWLVASFAARSGSWLAHDGCSRMHGLPCAPTLMHRDRCVTSSCTPTRPRRGMMTATTANS